MTDDDFMLRVLVFVDRNGYVLSKGSTPMHTSLSMKYVDKLLDIKMNATAYAQGNGSCNAIVKYKGKTVYSAGGCFTSGPWGVKVKTYKPGAWEKLITEYPHR